MYGYISPFIITTMATRYKCSKKKKKASKHTKILRRTARKRRTIGGNNHFRVPRCAPNSNVNKAFDSTCLSASQIEEMRVAHNRKYPNKIISQSTPEQVHTQLKEAEAGRCNAERCLVKEYLSPKVVKEQFAPRKPKLWKKKPKAWLADSEIQDVMNQYEKNSNFAFYGPSMIDYDFKYKTGKCECQALCKFSSAEHIQKGKPLVGVVFNLDKHNEKGSHWTALFLDLNESVVMYFDSAGDPPPPEVKRLVTQMQETIPPGHTVPRFTYNSMEHQKGTSECGMYSMYFLITSLRANSRAGIFKEFNDTRIPDAKVAELRNVYFD